MIQRREFLRTSALGAAGLALSRFAPTTALAQSRTVEAHIEVLVNEPLGTISPNIYGHFTENLGGVIYDGLRVGENSKVVNGIRKSVIDHMRAIKAPVIRFPGGCFADSYDWRDGIGPRGQRARRTNFWGGTDTNQFGTNEFVQFCKLVGAEPYLAASVRSLPASATMTVLTAPDLHAHNTFAQPNAVVPKAGEAKTTASGVVITIPPASVVAVSLHLA